MILIQQALTYITVYFFVVLGSLALDRLLIAKLKIKQLASVRARRLSIAAIKTFTLTLLMASGNAVLGYPLSIVFGVWLFSSLLLCALYYFFPSRDF